MSPVGERIEVRVCVEGSDAGVVVAKSSRTGKHPAPWFSTTGEGFTEREVSTWPRIASGTVHEGRWFQDHNRVPPSVLREAWEAFDAYRFRPAFLRAMAVINAWLASNSVPAAEQTRPPVERKGGESRG